MFCKVVFDVPLDRDFDYLVPKELEDRLRPGMRITAPFGRQLTGGLVTQVTEVSNAPANVQLKEITSLVDEHPLYGSDLFPLARFIKSRWGGPIGQILFGLIPSQPYFKLADAPSTVSISVKTPDFQLTSAQENTLQTLRQEPAYQFAPYLLSGPAHSGKTETALRLAGESLAGYGQVLITVPDIAAARQFIWQAQQRFGEDNAFCWHSRMLLSKKKKYFSAISNGLPCIVIGTRSATLLPFKNLRLCVMLDEGDDNYKQEENKPYYHARDVLLFRAKMHGATALLVSATPSVETEKMVQDGILKHLVFKQTVPGRGYRVQVKITSKKGDKSKFFSDFLLAEIEENLRRKQQTLLFLNRQGYANAYYCLNCGTYAKCKKCGAVLSREKTSEHDGLVCKKCGQREPLEQECPKCHNVIFKSRGGGTQKIAAEVSKFFPMARVLRLESDTLKTKAGQGFEALNALHTGQADIIVGTRVAAGALRGAKITLSAVLDADLELNTPDYRSSEKFGRLLFDLYGQLSGQPNGRLIIQTADAEAYDYAPLSSGDYTAAAEAETSLRESFNYPPFVHLFRMTLKSKDNALLQAETARLRRLCAPLAAEILGPVWCAKKTDTLKKQYLLFKTDESRRADLLAALDTFEPVGKVTVKLAADPYDFY